MYLNLAADVINLFPRREFGLPGADSAAEWGKGGVRVEVGALARLFCVCVCVCSVLCTCFSGVDLKRVISESKRRPNPCSGLGHTGIVGNRCDLHIYL